MHNTNGQQLLNKKTFHCTWNVKGDVCNFFKVKYFLLSQHAEATVSKPLIGWFPKESVNTVALSNLFIWESWLSWYDNNAVSLGQDYLYFRPMAEDESVLEKINK